MKPPRKKSRKKNAPKIPNALLKRYGKPVQRAKPVHSAEGESGPVRILMKNGVPSGEILPVREGRFKRTFYRKVKPVIKVKKAGAALTVARPGKDHVETTIPGADGLQDEAESGK